MVISNRPEIVILKHKYLATMTRYQRRHIECCVYPNFYPDILIIYWRYILCFNCKQFILV